MSIHEIAIDARGCDYCGVTPGESCRTAGGEPTKVHASRTAGLWHAYYEGYDRALYDVSVAHTPKACSICQGAES